MVRQIRNFSEDLKNSQLLKEEWKRVLPKLFKNGTVIFHDGIETQKLGFDITIDDSKRKYSVDLKTRRFTYLKRAEYVLEIIHHRYSDKEMNHKINSKKGWLYDSIAEHIIFGTLTEDEKQIIELCCFSLVPFKDESFKQQISNLRTVTSEPTKFSSGIYQITILKLVSKFFLKQFANFYRYRIDPEFNY